MTKKFISLFSWHALQQEYIWEFLLLPKIKLTKLSAEMYYWFKTNVIMLSVKRLSKCQNVWWEKKHRNNCKSDHFREISYKSMIPFLERWTFLEMALLFPAFCLTSFPILVSYFFERAEIVVWYWKCENGRHVNFLS